MIRDFHIAKDEKDISKYSGYLASCYAFCQFLFSVQWGKLSDKVGRKPILMFGLTGTSISLVLFGFAKNFYWALAARCLSGCLNGNVGVLRTMVGEIATEKRHQATAFSILPLLYNVGSVIGPLVGGYFTYPNDKSPYDEDSGSMISTSAGGPGSAGSGVPGSFTQKYPYAVSNIIVASCIWLSVTSGFLFLEETNPKLISRRDYGLDLGDWLLNRFGFTTKQRPWHKPVIHTNDPPDISHKATNNPEDLYGLEVNQPQFEYDVEQEDYDLHREDYELQQDYDTDDDHYSESSAILDNDERGRDPDPQSSSYQPRPLPETTETSETAQSTKSHSRRPSEIIEPIFNRQVIISISSNFILSMHGVIYSEFVPVFLGSPYSPDIKFPFKISGGFNLDPSTIGGLFSSTGLVGMFIIMSIFPWLDHKLGTLRGYRFSLSIIPFVYFFLPLSIFTLYQYNHILPPWFTIMCLYTLTSLRTLATATGLPQIMLLNHRAAAKQHRAFVNGFTMSMLALARFIGPMIFGFVMSVGNKHYIGWLGWWSLSVLALFGFLQSFFLVDNDD